MERNDRWTHRPFAAKYESEILLAIIHPIFFVRDECIMNSTFDNGTTSMCDAHEEFPHRSSQKSAECCVMYIVDLEKPI
jgi:hypothetical protein